MSYQILRNIGANGAWAAGASRKVVRVLGANGAFTPNVNPSVGLIAGMRVVRLPSGPPGAGAGYGAEFAWPGPTISGEAPLPHTERDAGTITAPNLTGSCEVAASAPAVFQAFVDLGAGFVLAFTATFSPTSGLGPPAFAISVTAYPAGARFKCVPPASADATLYGASIVFFGR